MRGCVYRVKCGRKLSLGAAVLVVAVAIASDSTAALHAQSAAPDWQKAAGGHQEFDVASVREDKTGAPSHSNFSLDNGNAWFTVSQKDVLAPNGTLFSAISVPLLHYITFAYKLSGTEELALRMDYWAGLDLHVPDWVRNDRYDIEARTSEPATKDQMRLMMQSLLAERFKLAVHWEAREVPVFVLALATPGTPGPHSSRIRQATTARRPRFQGALTAVPAGERKEPMPRHRTQRCPFRAAWWRVCR